jgi:hypothetical protein
MTDARRQRTADTAASFSESLATGFRAVKRRTAPVNV